MEDRNNFKYQISNIKFPIYLWLTKLELSRLFPRLFFYFKIWLLMSRNAFMMYFNQKKILAIFLTGKILRFSFFTAFLYFLVNGSNGLAGYSSREVIFFFLTYNIVDITSQFLFREVYRFRSQVISGDLDLILAKPINPLFRVLFGGADLIDFITIPPLVFTTIYLGIQLNPTVFAVALYVLLISNALLVSLSFHILVVALGIVTLEVDNTVMIFRDLSRLGTVPIDIFKEPFKGFITFIIPIGIMLSFPAKAFLGRLGFGWIIIAITFSLLSFVLALKFWNFALKKYTSAG